MSVELHADDEAAGLPRALELADGDEPEDRRRPNVSGDLPTVLEVAPMFHRSALGYDRFEVDTYVQWAEDELATADRERRHLEARHLRTQAALEEAQQLLAHSAAGGDFLQASRRIGAVLAVAADEADSMRAEAAADRSAAAAEAQRAADEAERLLEEAAVEARRMVAEAATEVEAANAEAARLADEARRTLAAAHADAAARLDEVRASEQRAVEDADALRRRTDDEISAARLRARDEIVGMLNTGREARRRADDAAAAARNRLDAEATARRAALLAEIAALEEQRSTLRAELERTAPRPVDPPGSRLDVQLRQLVDRLRWWVRSEGLAQRSS